MQFPTPTARRRTLLWLSLAALLIAVGGLAISKFTHRPQTGGQSPSATHPEALAEATRAALQSQAGVILPDTGRPEGQAEVPIFGVFELQLTAENDSSNPYLLMPGDNTTPGYVVGIFTGPNGENIQLDGFWDGGRTWKIRMAPTAEGTWNYRTVSSDPGLDGKTGSFQCTPSSSRGFLRVDPQHPHHFTWDDGTPFYWAALSLHVSHFGDTSPDSRISRLDDGSFQSMAATRSEQGFNVTHWGYYGFSKPMFNNHTQKNEGGAPFINYDPDLLNPAYYQYGDQRVEVLQQNEIITEFTLGWPDQGIASSIGHGRLKRYWRYLIARYAAYNVVYNLFGEIQEFGNYLNVLKDYAALTRAWDPYHHLLTTHTMGDLDPTLAELESLDFITLQRLPANTSDYLKYSKPVLNSEYGGYEDNQVNGDQLRPLMWAVRMHGGYFAYESWGSNLRSSGAEYAQYVNTFFKDRTRFWELEYHPELFNGNPGLANPGREYVYYATPGATIKVNLTPVSGNFNVAWYNPRTGESRSAGTVSAGKVRTLTAPDGKDWVLHLTQTVEQPLGDFNLYLPVNLR